LFNPNVIKEEDQEEGIAGQLSQNLASSGGFNNSGSSFVDLQAGNNARKQSKS